MPEPSPPIQIPTTVLDLAKLYIQQFGSLTFGVITLVLIWMVIVKPQMEINENVLKSQQEILELLHRHAQSLEISVLHMEKTVEMQDRHLLREQEK